MLFQMLLQSVNPQLISSPLRCCPLPPLSLYFSTRIHVGNRLTLASFCPHLISPPGHFTFQWSHHTVSFSPHLAPFQVVGLNCPSPLLLACICSYEPHIQRTASSTFTSNQPPKIAPAFPRNDTCQATPPTLLFFRNYAKKLAPHFFLSHPQTWFPELPSIFPSSQKCSLHQVLHLLTPLGPQPHAPSYLGAVPVNR